MVEDGVAPCQSSGSGCRRCDDAARWRGVGIVPVSHRVHRAFLETHPVSQENHHVHRAAELEKEDLRASFDADRGGALFDNEAAWLDHARRRLDHPGADKDRGRNTHPVAPMSARACRPGARSSGDSESRKETPGGRFLRILDVERVKRVAAFEERIPRVENLLELEVEGRVVEKREAGLRGHRNRQEAVHRGAHHFRFVEGRGGRDDLIENLQEAVTPINPENIAVYNSFPMNSISV